MVSEAISLLVLGLEWLLSLAVLIAVHAEAQSVVLLSFVRALGSLRLPTVCVVAVVAHALSVVFLISMLTIGYNLLVFGLLGHRYIFERLGLRVDRRFNFFNGLNRLWDVVCRQRLEALRRVFGLRGARITLSGV